jgi:D-alanyl-D-alanine dipeptidase/carboxypeptidase
MRSASISHEDIFTGPLLLVNAEHHLKADSPVRLVPLDGISGVFLEAKAATLLSQLMLTIRCGRRILPVSGFRSRNEQELIYVNSLRENGEAFTRKYVALPDCSEHQTGYAVDLAENTGNIDLLRPSFPYDGIYRDFRNLAAKFGFIERYGRDKEHLTGIAHEPWHFRYIGYPHSSIMRENGLCLEEYIDFIKSYPYNGDHLCFGQTELFFADADCAAAGLELPEDDMQISGNNVDGFIVTIWRQNS